MIATAQDDGRVRCIECGAMVPIYYLASDGRRCVECGISSRIYPSAPLELLVPARIRKAVTLAMIAKPHVRDAVERRTPRRRAHGRY